MHARRYANKEKGTGAIESRTREGERGGGGEPPHKHNAKRNEQVSAAFTQQHMEEKKKRNGHNAAGGRRDPSGDGLRAIHLVPTSPLLPPPPPTHLRRPQTIRPAAQHRHPVAEEKGAGSLGCPLMWSPGSHARTCLRLRPPPSRGDRVWGGCEERGEGKGASQGGRAGPGGRDRSGCWDAL